MAAIVTGIVDIINAIFLGGCLFLTIVAMCFFTLYFLGFTEEQKKKTNEHIIKVIEKITREKEKSKWQY